MFNASPLSTLIRRVGFSDASGLSSHGDTEQSNQDRSEHRFLSARQSVAVFAYLTSVDVNLLKSRITITAVASHRMCTHSNRQLSRIDGRGNSHWLAIIAPSRANLLLRYHDAIMFSRNRVNGSERIQVWAHCLSLSCVVVVEPPTASRRNGTGVLWVLTGTHRCDDPPTQDSEPSERQLVQCIVAWVRALLMSYEGTFRRDIRSKKKKKRKKKRKKRKMKK